MADLELLGDLRCDVLSPIATSFVTLLPPTGRTAVWNGEPSAKSARSIVPGADVGDGDAELLLRLGRGPPRPTRAESTTSSSIFTPGRGDALGQVLTAVAEAVTMWVSTSSRMRAHPERILDALLAVDR